MLCLLVASLVFIEMRYVDWPARPDVLLYPLTNILQEDAGLIDAFYQYDLGGWFDHQWLWRIDAHPDDISRIVARLDLKQTDEIPDAFWRMPPHYWPRSRGENIEAFQSARFIAESRGQDGCHFFMLYDRTQGRAYVWFKDNF